MRICRWSLVFVCCLLLTGCASILDREYRVVELHSSKFWESDADDILRAENYQDIVNDLLLLVGEYQRQATLRLYSDDSEAAVEAELERAAAEIQKDTPLGAYAVSYIITESEQQHDYHEVTVRISYRCTREQMKSIVNATSATALESLLSAAMESGSKELVVRLGYWNEGDEELVNSAMLAVEEDWGLTGSQIWTARYYPSLGEVGLIEFRLEPAPPRPAAPQEPEKPVDPEVPVGDETPAEGETPTEGQQPAESEQPADGKLPASGEPPVEASQPGEQGGESAPVGGEGENAPAPEVVQPPENDASAAAEEKKKENVEKTENFP
ncbi:MAG: hypothetical protein E7445_10355 [Ruminococcaceae bacterium]|nr:hypothetical protein [Oscillospiraceae bacterium]